MDSKFNDTKGIFIVPLSATLTLRAFTEDFRLYFRGNKSAIRSALVIIDYSSTWP